ncbi:MAG: Glycosyl transferase family 2 [Candidatus Curtissbacteria bacterium GW2011_GWA1_41_11]|uniref:Glycosyl transferase family 2 n=1 Tax=Candidatus Curtissbacteria bacterium GW2011_GWA1_41_11 TaxID=1618409 RepID=A0A0G0UH46_9BACT|nr:MAG: Glycosyl transferase family 2 [Candidatus Curtissbacteria bacterium GW2011_GWA1_41_11]
MLKPEVSIVLSCYNEGPTLENSIQRVVSILKKQRWSWEIIFVEDKSTDDTKQTIDKICNDPKNCNVIYHSKNQGRGKSVSDGIKAAKGEICGYIDVDLEVSEKYIPLFIQEVEKGNELVVGKRFYEGGLKHLTRVIVSRVYAIALKKIIDLPIDDTEAGYKFFNRIKILPIISKVKSKHWFWDTEICAQAHRKGLKVTQLPVLFIRRVDKKSTVRLIPDTIDYLKNLIRLRAETPK